MADTPQINFQSNQNNDLNIQDMYKDFVTGGATPGDNEVGENIGIDDLRGQISVSVTGTKTADLIASLHLDPSSQVPASTPNTSTPVQFAQESRCHAFYRIIGFPVVAVDKTFYNPGHDIIKKAGATRSLTLERKIQIASNVGKPFETISSARENYASSTAQIFGVPESLTAGVLCLTSGTCSVDGNVNLRSIKGAHFAAPFALSPDDPFDFSVNNQSYSASIFDTATLVGNKEVSLADFQDANGLKNGGVDISVSTNVASGVLHQHNHIIKPFMVDPRIDFSIGAADSRTASQVSRRIAVPFVPDASFLKTSATAFAERPLLEKIITDRFNQFDNTNNSGDGIQALVDYVKSVKSIQNVNFANTTISSIFSGKIFNLSQQAAFAKYLSVIQALMSKLVESINIIRGVQGDYYWLPQPSINGPENGGVVRDILFNQNISQDIITAKDRDIIISQTQSVLSNINSSIAQATGVPDKGGYAFSGFFKLTFDSGTSDSHGNLSTKTLNGQLSKREAAIKKAIDAMQTVEMIVGEFSGLGLCDIIAVMGGLYVMPQNDLLGFLDDDAIIRAETVLGYPFLSSLRPSLAQAMTSLSNDVKGFYLIMDKIFEDYLNNNALNIS